MMTVEASSMERMFQAYIRGKVREAILKIAEPVIDAAVEDALKEFKTQITQYRDAQYGSIVVNIMAERKEK